MKHAEQILIYAAGWLLFVVAQAQNSLLSSANSLTGWAGFKFWFRVQWVNLTTRAFFSAILYGFLIDQVSKRLQAVGFVLTGAAVAGCAGYAANALLYQAFGLLAKAIPGLRVEIHDLAPTQEPKP